MTREDRTWLTLGAGVAVLLLLAVLLGGCAPQRVVCPGWALPSGVNTDDATTGQVGATVGLLTQSGKAAGRWGGTTSVDYNCKSPCPKGSLLRYSKTAQGETLECLPVVGARDGGAAGGAEPRDGR